MKIVILREAIQFSVPRLPKSLNTTNAMHWRARVRDKEDWLEELLCCDWDSHLHDPRHALKQWAKEQRKVRVEIHQYRIQLMDEDNLWGSVKHVLDACKRLGWLWDDSQKAIKLVVKQTKESKRALQRTVITISPMSARERGRR